MADELDRKIIQALNRNARKSYREIAREVGTSVTAVIHRIKKFEETGAVKGYIPVVDQEHFGLSLSAIIALRISRGKLLDIQQEIARDRRIAAVYDVTGDWDSIIVGYFRDRNDLNDFIKQLLVLENVDRSITHIVLNVVKEERRIPV
jgi:DNA-binding Lrp family transcriptional regulator